MRCFPSGAVFLVVACLSLWLLPGPLMAQPTSKALAEGPTDESIRLLAEAVTKMRKQMMPSVQSSEIVQGMLKTYLRSLDPFADYLSAEEVKQSNIMQESQYAGVGMELEQEPSGRVVCFPYPESPAMQAGIATGDILEAVNGVKTTNLSLLTIGLKIRGQAGTAVGLRVSKTDGGQKDVHIIRTAFQTTSVQVETQGPVPRVRLSTFTLKTPQELKNALSTLRNATAVILDLRGNPGGTLFGGIEAAKLFVARGQKIAALQTQEGVKAYRNDLAAPPFLATTLYLWQDAWTASAAEVFLAALSQNQRALTIGTTTFGKGTAQDIITLADGSALKLTTGYIQTPDGTLYHQKGLKPAYPLSSAPAKTAEYMAQVIALIEQPAVLRLPSIGGDKSPTTTPLPKPKSPPLDVQITLKAPHTAATPEPRQRTTLLCFDKDFATDRTAETWSMEVRASLSDQWEYYLLRRQKTTGIAFVVCLGPFQSAEEAEKKRPMLADAMQTLMFTEEVDNSAAP